MQCILEEVALKVVVASLPGKGRVVVCWLRFSLDSFHTPTIFLCEYGGQSFPYKGEVRR